MAISACGTPRRAWPERHAASVYHIISMFGLCDYVLHLYVHGVQMKEGHDKMDSVSNFMTHKS